ncbi:ABC transporter ATP-binding protein [bacterium]|nr:ABC transporter ATP-binding protein [bacterium]
MKPNVIEIIDLKKTYTMGENEVPALRGISLEVEKGEYIAIMGPSGSGKSTLMNIIGCLDRPTAGKYILEGLDVSTFSRDRRAEIRNEKIGFIFQNFNLLARTSAIENVELPLIYSHKNSLTDQQMRERASDCMKRVGLSGWEEHTPAQLSGGQQQRVAIARALINEPAILLADEPTGNLDTKTSEQVMEIFQRLNEEGISIALITHEMDIAEHAKRIVMLRDGEIVADQAVGNRRYV